MLPGNPSSAQDDVDTYDPSRPVASEIRTFFTCIMFLTRLPCPSWTDHHPAYLMRSMLYFPPVGLLVGAWGATWHASTAALWGPRIAAVVSTASTVWLTGCFHEDGLADTIDGFGGGWGRAQILRIMKDSRVGTYGCVGMILAQFLKVEALARLEGPHAGRALLVGHCLGRWVSLPLLFFSVYIQVRVFLSATFLSTTFRRLAFVAGYRFTRCVRIASRITSNSNV
jgi:adenosylcobinamide-GDP ribazoletransferase